MTIEEKEQTFREVVATHRDRIYRLCFGYVKDHDERQDIYQEVLIHVWEGLEKFDGRAQIGTWIYRIAVNTCFGFFRSQGRRSKIFERGYGPAAQSVAEGATDPDIEVLYQGIGRLVPADRVLITLFLEDLTTAEIAGILGMSEGTVRVRLHRVRRRLKDLLEEEYHGS